MSAYFALYRRNKINYKDRVRVAVNVLVAPANGKVVKIIKSIAVEGLDHEATIVRIKIGLFDEWGVYFPFSSRVESFLEKAGDKFFRAKRSLDLEKYSNNSILLENTKNHKVMLRVLPCVFGLRGNFWVNSGDQGKANACMGFLPFGGTLELVIDGQNDVLVNDGDKIQAGNTVIVGIKE